MTRGGGGGLGSGEKLVSGFVVPVGYWATCLELRKDVLYCLGYLSDTAKRV